MSCSTAKTANRQQQQRSKFTADVIRAIEELELRRSYRSPQELADAAWQKLQYDLPVVELAELQALLEHLSSSLQGKTSWPCYLLSNKALENITSGAKHSTTFEPVRSEQEQKLQKLLDVATTSTFKSETARISAVAGSSSSTPHSQQQADQQAQQHQRQHQAEGPSVQQMYQQLCAVVLLQYTAKVASVPEQDAWQLLMNYWPEQLDEQDASSPVDRPQHQRQQQQELQQMLQQGVDHSSLGAALAAAAGNTSIAGTTEADSTQAASTSIYEVREAAVQDSDEEQYEELVPIEVSAITHGGSSNRQCSVGAPATGAVQQLQQYSWPDLLQKLHSIAECVQYSLLAYEPLWQQQQAAQHLLQLLRALGVHKQAEQLQPILHAYVGLLVDRLAAAPADLPLLQQLWEALGLTSVHGSGRSGVQGFKGAAKPQQALPGEAVLGFSVAASVWSQLQGASAKAKLWKLIYDNLLPVLEQCSEQLAYSMGGSSRSSRGALQANGAAAGAAGQQQQQQQQAVMGEGFAHMLLVSHIVQLLVLGRQGSTDVAGALTQHGVMRNMVVLFGQHADNAASEPLRRAVLLSCCSSQQAASWALAVPSVLQQLQQPAFQLQGSAEAHGAVWELLTSRNSSSQTAGKSSSTTITNSSSSSSLLCTQLQALLALSPAVSGDMQRQVTLLQLLVDVQQAVGRQQLWGQQVQQSLKQLASSIKALQSGPAVQVAAVAAVDAGVVHAPGAVGASVEIQVEGTTSGLGNGGAAGDFAGDKNNDTYSVDDDGKGAKAARRVQQQQQSSISDAGEAEEFGHRQSQQLQPAALKLIKQLLTSGGKTD